MVVLRILNNTFIFTFILLTMFLYSKAIQSTFQTGFKLETKVNDKLENLINYYKNVDTCLSSLR